MSILCYHAVDPCWQSPLAVTPELFETHCAWLARHRTVVPLRVALDRMDRRGRLPRGMVALTFDDGFAQLDDLVFPALARHRLPATVFLVTATLTDEGHPVDWVDTPPPDWELQTLTREQVLAAQGAGIEFESHSWAHLTLPELDEEECRADLRSSRELLEDLLHKRVDLLAYPRGFHDAKVRRATEAAGFSRGLALPDSREQAGPYAVPRIGVFPGNGETAMRLKTYRRYVGIRQSRVFPVVRAVGRAVS
jgi:peptidoglycan/xylan/chitin deacetylase (PgdA/CDA1 family)